MERTPEPFFNKSQQVWTVKLSCIQDRDDESPTTGDNEFELMLHRHPGGGWYFRFMGNVALDFDVDLPGLRNQLNAIAHILKWEN